jgi:acetyl-CoA carboxylase biotin carboxyl carrier protein
VIIWILGFGFWDFNAVPEDSQQPEETMDLTEDEVTQILKWIEDSHFDELDLRMGEIKLVVRKRRDGSPAKEEVANEAPAQAVAPVKSAMEVQRGKTLSTARETEDKSAEIPEQGLAAVRSPMLGTFYRCPSPGAPPYVEVGSHVEEGDTICLIEVMKVFNAVKAGVKGSIAKIFPETGELVEYGQTLFLVSQDDHIQKKSIG